MEFEKRTERGIPRARSAAPDSFTRSADPRPRFDYARAGERLTPERHQTDQRRAGALPSSGRLDVFPNRGGQKHALVYDR